MKKFLILPVILAVILINFSLSFAQFGNYATPQLEWISNALPRLWDQPKEDLLRIMDIFPDFICTDYDVKVGCVSKYNWDHANIYITYFTDDYETKHDNLWKASFTVDMQSADQQNELLNLFWLDGLKPIRSDDDVFSYPALVPMQFENETTKVTFHFKTFGSDSYAFFLAEFYPKE